MKRIIRSSTQTRGKEILHNLQSISTAHAVPYSFLLSIKVLCVFGSSLHSVSRLSTHWTTSPLPHTRTWCHATGSTENNYTLSARVQNCEKRVLSSSCLSVRLSVWMEQLGSHCSDLKEILYLSVFRKSVEKIQVSLKCYKLKATLYEEKYTFLSYLAQFFWEWQCLRKSLEKIETYIQWYLG